jgi:hypothetical protein
MSSQLTGHASELFAISHDVDLMVTDVSLGHPSGRSLG